MDSHVTSIGKYDQPALVAVVNDNFAGSELDSNLWYDGHTAQGHMVYVRDKKLMFTGVSMVDDFNIMSISGTDLMTTPSNQWADNESCVVLKAAYPYVAKMVLEVRASAGGKGESHNVISLTSIDDNPEWHCSYGVFFKDGSMFKVGYANNDSWTTIAKVSGAGNPYWAVMKIVYDFKNLNTEFYVNNELMFSDKVIAFLNPIVIVGAGNNLKGQNLINAYSNLKVTYYYLDKSPDGLDLQI